MTIADTATPPPLPSEHAPLGPVADAQRVVAIDVLRGFALLGILAMNIITFALPMDAYVNPLNEHVNRYAGEFRGSNRATWLAQHVVFDQKMMTIFSMLFGAGLVLLDQRAASAGKYGFASIYYRRLAWLFVIGMAHAYLLWYGDILVTYAICGLALYPVRNWRPRWLIFTGLVVLLITVFIELLLGGAMWYVREQAQRGNAEFGRMWAQISQDLSAGAEDVEEQVRGFGGTLPQVLGVNAKLAAFFQLLLLPMMFVWRALGLMLVGMALMKLGVFSAQRSNRFYAWVLLVGLGVGLPVVIFGAFDQVAHGFDPVYQMLAGAQYNYLGSVLVALGYVAMVMLVVKLGAAQWLTARLAAVGRMALTNYLAQTLICTFIFFGWGLGYFAHFERKWLPPFVVGVWLLQLLWSPWWLARFRFGPMEWLWRSLTYKERQPFSRSALSTGMS